MGKHKSFILIFLFLFCGVWAMSRPVQAAPTTTQTNPTATVVTGALNVRSGPSVSYPVLAVVYQGQVVTLLGRNTSSTWVKVRISGGQEGWVNASYLQSTTPIGSLPVIDSGPPPTPTASAVIISGAANVRSGPGLGYGVVTIVYQGQNVTLLGRNSEASWVKVRTAGGQEGWVNVSLLQANVPIGSLPVMDSGLPSAWAIVTTGAANVRSGPGIGYGVVTVVYQNEVVTLLGRNNNASWVQVRLANGITGWINASLLDGNIAISSLPVTG